MPTDQKKIQRLQATLLRLEKQRPPADRNRTLGDVAHNPNLDDTLSDALRVEMNKAGMGLIQNVGRKKKR